MRWDQLTENLDQPDLIKFINDKCGPYLQANPKWKTNPLYRGMNYEDPYIIKQIRSNRKPLDTLPYLQKIYDDALSAGGIIAKRSNSIFCTGDKASANFYGLLYVVFPIGDFDFTYSATIRDLTSQHNEFILSGDIRFKNKDKPVLNHQDISNLLILWPELKTLPEKFSLNDMAKIVPNLKAFFSRIGNNLEDVYTRLGFDVDHFNKEFSKHFKTDDLQAAIKSKHEILITGSKYLAISDKTFKELIKG